MKTYQGSICKGSILLGTGCKKCEKCLDEMKSIEDNHIPAVEFVPAKKWISVHKSLPKDGQKIRGKSDTGEWEEVWDSSEPIGHMTHWKSA